MVRNSLKRGSSEIIILLTRQPVYRQAGLKFPAPLGGNPRSRSKNKTKNGSLGAAGFKQHRDQDQLRCRNADI